MTEPLRTVAQFVVSGGRIIAAVWQFAWGLVFATLALWLVFGFQNWFAWVLGILCGLDSGYLLVTASETYLSAQPNKRQDEVDQKRRSQSLYVSTDHQRARQEKRRPQQ
ncbi:hypothetical protein [Bradyrhizobium iriomotense]|uniref:DUF2628 domain-containing protein n=1 Tax=Bradyrhizobium iriomotense TaxID=441950 RepID=A0ABQ6B1V6_9BRAD|nr:hypothetical protein [Bradyrhizobium iriomotense]GLR86526.1 hypothetical protein GCM10007857_32370 [Bradyrhizobium iriomotense]